MRAYILCSYGEEDSAVALEDFFKARVRRANGDEVLAVLPAPKGH